jgi:hypothetical protein
MKALILPDFYLGDCEPGLCQFVPRGFANLFLEDLPICTWRICLFVPGGFADRLSVTFGFMRSLGFAEFYLGDFFLLGINSDFGFVLNAMNTEC